MNVLIVDDDTDFSLKIRNDFLDSFSAYEKNINVDIINSDFSNIKDFTYDLAFLDIDLIDGNGIKIGKKIREAIPRAILIYVSAHEKMIFQALSTGVFQFIRKTNYEEDKRITFSQLKKQFNKNFVKVITVNKRTMLINLYKVSYIISIGKDVVVIQNNEQTTIRSSMDDILKLLNYPYLIQIQRNTAVNCNFIKKIEGHSLITLDGKEYKIGRKYYNKVNLTYREFILL